MILQEVILIKIIKDNIFNSTAQALVNPVNTNGVMSKGLAREFRDKYPLNFKNYAEKCLKYRLHAGDILTFEENGRSIVNFATKDNWKNPSKIEWIHKGLLSVMDFIVLKEIQSIAIPKIGCGLGGLDWLTVKQMIIYSMEHIKNYNFTTEIYE